MEYYSEEVLEVVAAKEHTFDEMALPYDLPVEYALLFEKISAARKNDRIRIMREIVKRKCPGSDVMLDEAAATGITILPSGNVKVNTPISSGPR